MAKTPFKPLIVGLGHPRCGTGFTASLLQSAGFDVGHEEVRADGIVSWLAAAERAAVPFGQSSMGKLKGHRIFCAVRSPVESIPSIVPENERPRSIAWRAQVIWERTKVDICSLPAVPPNRIALAVASYVHWFEICLAHKPGIVFRIDRNEDDALLSDFAGREVRRSKAVRTNARPRLRFDAFKPRMLWRAGPDLLTRFAGLADRFGYPEDAEVIRGQVDQARTEFPDLAAAPSAPVVPSAAEAPPPGTPGPERAAAPRSRRARSVSA